MHDDGEVRPGWRWTLTILNKEAPIALATGPYKNAEALEAMIVGRVIGVVSA